MRQQVTVTRLGGCAFAALAVMTNWSIARERDDGREAASAAGVVAQSETEAADSAATTSDPVQPATIAPFVAKGVGWLIAAQHPDGGWGGGSHAQQQIRDPHQVQTDPATTAFTLLALLRAGHAPVDGEYQSQVRRGLEYLVAAVKKAPLEGPRITEITGTQPQRKLGPLVDTALTAQYLARALELLDQEDPLYEGVDKSLDKCLAKLQASQQEDGGWGQGGGWAPVLQSSLSCSALEIAHANGKPVDETKLAAARDYQKQQVEVRSGRAVARTEAAAGVELYAYNSALRGGAAETRQAQRALKAAKAEGKLVAEAPVSADNLRTAGVAFEDAERLARAAQNTERQLRRLDDEKLLAGFGSKGGEEFLSYLLTSESLVIAGGEKFHGWNGKIHDRLQKIQNTDGSWSGHHCITSPVFCTAAVVQCLTTARDAEFLIAMADRTSGAKVAQAD